MDIVLRTNGKKIQIATVAGRTCACVYDVINCISRKKDLKNIRNVMHKIGLSLGMQIPIETYDFMTFVDLQFVTNILDLLHKSTRLETMSIMFELNDFINERTIHA